VAGIDDLAAMREPIERRHRKVELSAFDQLWHLTVEESNQQRSDMRAIHIGVGHHDDLLVAQVLLMIVRARATTEGLDQIGKLRILCELVLAGRGDVQDLSAQWQHSLRAAVARLLGRAAGAVAPPKKDFLNFPSP